MSLFVNRIQGISPALNVNKIAPLREATSQSRFVQNAVSSPYSLTHPRANDMEGIKASAVANRLDILA